MKRRQIRVDWTALNGETSSQIDRQGSTLLIVMALLGLLALLGFVFYTFAAQERENAVNFTLAAINEPDDGLDVDVYFDFALEQLVVGPNPNRRQSVLWGGRYSMIRNMYGWDNHPFNGVGGNNPLALNYTAAAQNGNPQNPQDPAGIGPANASPDVDYTYPDFNNVFLAYHGFVLDPNTGNDVRVIIPSFHRPQFLRNDSALDPLNPFDGTPIANWQSDPGTVARIFRPHPAHVIEGTTDERYDAATFIQLNPDNNDPLVGGDGDGNTEQGVWSWEAADPTTHTTDYEFDVDNDGDGIKEGVYLDLDFPVQSSAAGDLFIPLFSFTVYDLDSLINLNVHGNLQNDLMAAGDLTAVNFNMPAGQLLSRSNAGLGPHEVNALRALTGDPSAVPPAALTQHTSFYTWSPTDRTQLANQEWWFLNMGRAEFPLAAPPELFSGRWGELARLNNGLGTMDPIDFPFPGISTVDDNNDRFEGEEIFGRRAFGQPQDFRGLGRFTLTGNPKQARIIQPFVATNNPSVYLQYAGYTTEGTVQWMQVAFGPDGAPGVAGSDDNSDGNIDLLPNGLPDLGELLAGGSDDIAYMTGPYIDALANDPMELTADPTQAQPPFDQIYGAQDVPFFFLANSEINNSLEPPESRAGKLGIVNFSTDPTVNPLGPDIRKMFTTLSFDRKEFPIAAAMQAGPGFNRRWETDQNNDANPDFFPPQFGSVQAYDDTTLDGNGVDPFRPQLRRLLETNWNNTTELKLQQLLSVNHLLDIERQPSSPGNERYGPLLFRPLTTHPVDPAVTAGGAPVIQNIPPASPLPIFPPQDFGGFNALEVQEFWARRDRQKMARDIYVLLYTIGGGNDAQNYTAANPYSNAEVQEIAQFAANLIDFVDRDNVISKIEVDTNLANGWDLDDDPFTDDGGNPDRLVVYGVERQQLTLSEGLAIQSAQIGGMGADHNATMYDDTTGVHNFMYVELRSTSPEDVYLSTEISTDHETGIWRIRRDDDGNGQLDLPPIGNDDDFVFREPPGPGSQTIGPGEQFSIGMNDGNNIEPMTMLHRPSDFRVDYDLDGTGACELIVPNKGGIDFAMVPTAATSPVDYGPFVNLCLVHQTHEERWRRSTAPNQLKGQMALGFTPGQSVTLVLERRLNLDQPKVSVLPITGNEWVEVDRITFPIQVFDIKDGDGAAAIHDPADATTDLLDALKSRERIEPFDRQIPDPLFNEDLGAGADVPFSSTMFGTGAGTTAKNWNSPAVFNYWQPHLDRDLGSMAEILSVPLYDPKDTSRYFKESNRSAEVASAPRVAAHRMLNADPDGAPGTGDESRWYRLLAFLEVPTRTHRQLGDPLKTTRVPGRINLNMIRYPEILHALLDDDEILARDFTPGNGQYLNDLTGDSPDWWLKFLASRDDGGGAGGTDIVSGLRLPGVFGSRPFRGFSHLAISGSGGPSADETLFRKISGNDRHLFELGNEAEHDSNNPTVGPDQFTRHRLLSKIMNNVTTRSNTFVVFLTVDFFNAEEHPSLPGSGKYWIQDRHDLNGDGSIDEKDRYRGVFVIDRSDIEEAYDQGSGTFDWKVLVKHRLRIQ